MKNAIIAITAFVATAAASAGNAIVVNNCDYEVLIHNTPSNDGVHTEDDKTVSANGGQYVQQYTELTNGMGWSIKMAPTEADFSATSQNVAQYEYTNCGDGNIWFDMSFVDGSQWENNWNVSSDKSGCSPTADNYFSDPTSANGMQAQCDIDVSITVTLCSSSGSGSSSSGSSSSSSSAAASSIESVASSTSSPAASTTSEAASTTSSPAAYSTSTEVSSTADASSTSEAASTSAAASTSEAATSTSKRHWTRTWNQANVAAVTTVASATTFATSITTSVSSADTGDVIVTVTDVATAYATVVETLGANKRRDQHQHHTARHPHAGRA